MHSLITSMSLYNKDEIPMTWISSGRFLFIFFVSFNSDKQTF